ncbi:hypothetical protein BDV18DRAFT_121483 [Aspergillus unguis]
MTRVTTDHRGAQDPILRFRLASLALLHTASAYIRHRDVILYGHTASSPEPSHHIPFRPLTPPPKTDPGVLSHSTTEPWFKPTLFLLTYSIVLMISTVPSEPPDWLMLWLNDYKPRCWLGCSSSEERDRSLADFMKYERHE